MINKNKFEYFTFFFDGWVFWKGTRSWESLRESFVDDELISSFSSDRVNLGGKREYLEEEEKDGEIDKRS